MDPRSDPEQYFSASWIDNATYQAAAQALAARNDNVQLQLLRPKQRAAYLILQRMEESLARASDQAWASLAVMVKSNYQSLVHQSFVDRSPFTPAFANDIDTRLDPDLSSHTDLDHLLSDPFLRLSTIALAGQDLLHVLLSIDPISGALEPEGLCEAGTKLRLHLDYNEESNSGYFRGKAFVVGNEAGGWEEAKKRAARFKQMIDERVARNEEERALLAWAYEDPVYGKSLEEWLWTGRLVVNQEKVRSGEDVSNALEMHWTGGEGGKEGGGVERPGGEDGKRGAGGGGEGGGGEGGVEITPIADVRDFDNQHGMWMRSLGFLNLVLGAVWVGEADRVMREAEVDFKAGEKQDPLLMARLDMGLNRRLSNLAYKLTLMYKLVWLRVGGRRYLFGHLARWYACPGKGGAGALPGL